jgi:hypothetical protein
LAAESDSSNPFWLSEKSSFFSISKNTALNSPLKIEFPWFVQTDPKFSAQLDGFSDFLNVIPPRDLPTPWNVSLSHRTNNWNSSPRTQRCSRFLNLTSFNSSNWCSRTTAGFSNTCNDSEMQNSLFISTWQRVRGVCPDLRRYSFPLQRSQTPTF